MDIYGSNDYNLSIVLLACWSDYFWSLITSLFDILYTKEVSD